MYPCILICAFGLGVPKIISNWTVGEHTVSTVLKIQCAISSSKCLLFAITGVIQSMSDLSLAGVVKNILCDINFICNANGRKLV